MPTNSKYYCPNCGEPLCNGKQIKLQSKRKNGKEGTLLLSISPGNFSYEHEPATFFEKGEVIDLLCNHCHTNLSSERFKGFSMIHCHCDENMNQEVYIANEAGKRKLYILSDNGLKAYLEK